MKTPGKSCGQPKNPRGHKLGAAAAGSRKTKTFLLGWEDRQSAVQLLVRKEQAEELFVAVRNVVKADCIVP